METTNIKILVVTGKTEEKTYKKFQKRLYKKYSDWELIGAINTVKMTEDGKSVYMIYQMLKRKIEK